MFHFRSHRGLAVSSPFQFHRGVVFLKARYGRVDREVYSVSHITTKIKMHPLSVLMTEMCCFYLLIDLYIR